MVILSHRQALCTYPSAQWFLALAALQVSVRRYLTSILDRGLTGLGWDLSSKIIQKVHKWF